jgi:hypothetical protein
MRRPNRIGMRKHVLRHPLIQDDGRPVGLLVEIAAVQQREAHGREEVRAGEINIGSDLLRVFDAIRLEIQGSSADAQRNTVEITYRCSAQRREPRFWAFSAEKNH